MLKINNKKKIMKKFLLSMALVCAAYVSAETTSNVSDLLNPLITGVPSLSIGPDAVAGGMGDVGTATVPDNNSQHWNSSKYAQMPSSAGFTMSYTPWLRGLGVNDIDLAYLSGYYQISQLAGTVSASLRFFSLGKIDLRDNIDATPISVKPYEIAFDAGYERMLSEHFSMGVVFRFICSDLSARQEDYYPGYAFGADINGYYELPIDIRMGTSKFAFGFNISNLGTKVSYDKGNTSNFLPTDLRLGVSYLLPFDRYNRLSFNFEADKLLVPSRKSKFAKNYDPNDESTWTMTDKEYTDISSMKGVFWSFADAPGGAKEEFQEINFGIGLEYAYNEQFFGRVGYHNEAKNKGNRKYFTFGAGFRLSAFRLDVGYVLSVAQNNPLDQTLRFSLSFDVDGIKALADRNKN